MFDESEPALAEGEVGVVGCEMVVVEEEDEEVVGGDEFEPNVVDVTEDDARDEDEDDAEVEDKDDDDDDEEVKEDDFLVGERRFNCELMDWNPSSKEPLLFANFSFDFELFFEGLLKEDEAEGGDSDEEDDFVGEMGRYAG